MIIPLTFSSSRAWARLDEVFCWGRRFATQCDSSRCISPVPERGSLGFARGRVLPWSVQKIDPRSTGPETGKQVIVGAGMMGDRVSIIFASVADLTRFLVEEC